MIYIIDGWQGHAGAITQMFLNKLSNTLMTGSKDKKVIMWQLPEKWRNEEIESFETKGIQYLNDKLAALRIQQALEKETNDDSSDDSLNGWDLYP